MKFAIIDIETTGGQAARERITEIAIVVHDGEKVIDTFSSLVNPERSIPYNITQITGITDSMVKDAPKFFEIAKQIVELTEGAIFVAHNVRFDYSFVQEEFRRLGFTYMRRQLCTVRLSRQAFPGLRSYALGNLIQHFRLKVTDRHRALADALATTEIFEKIIAKPENLEQIDDLVNLGIKESKLPANLSVKKLHELPETCGVYYLHNFKGDVVYVGKSINIKKRIFEHFADQTEKAAKLQAIVHDISFEETGSELVALLLESHEIKRIKPDVNKAQRNVNFPYAVFSYQDERGFVRFFASKNVATIRKKNKIVAEFTKLSDAKNTLWVWVKQFDLCERLIDLNFDWNTGGGCFSQQIGVCKGACIGNESAESYNQRTETILAKAETPFEFDFFILEEGKTKDEWAVVLVEEGTYRGFGYIDTDSALREEDLFECINNFPSNAETNRIIRQYISEKENNRKATRKFKIIKI